MFGLGIERPAWDAEKKYDPERIRIYYEDKFRPETWVNLIYPITIYSDLYVIYENHKLMGLLTETQAFLIKTNETSF